ncbi:MAG: hypothetical protein WBG92_24290 [Thiohalocapsa sp.]
MYLCDSVFIYRGAAGSWTRHLVMLLSAALVLLGDAVLDPGESIAGRHAASLVLLVGCPT